MKTAFVNRRPMCILALGFLCGILLFSVLFEGAAAPAALLALAVAVTARWTGRRDLALFLLLLALGLIRAMSAALEPAAPGTYLLTGTVAEAPEKTEDGYLLILSDAELDGERIRGRVRLTAEAISPAYGQRVQATAKVLPPPRKNAFYAYTRVSGIATELDGSYAVLENGKPDFYGALLRVRAFMGGRIDALFPNSFGAARGMLLGDKSALDEDMSRAVYGAGVGHLLAVSGIHVATLAGALALLTKRVPPRRRFLLLFSFLLFYSLLTAGAPSVLRASLMLLTGFAAPLCTRRPDPLSGLALSAFAVLLFRPSALFYAGFQLSFLAALGIILLSPILYDPLKPLGTAFAGTLSGSVAVTLMTLPASAALFGGVPPASIVTNMLVLPLFPLFLAPGFLSAAVGCVSLPLGRLLAGLPGLVLSGILALSGAADKTSLAIPAPHAAAFLLYLCAFFALSRYCLLRPRRRAQLFACLLVLALLLWR